MRKIFICCECSDRKKGWEASIKYAKNNGFNAGETFIDDDLRKSKQSSRENWIEYGIPCIVYEIDETGKLLWTYEYGKG